MAEPRTVYHYDWVDPESAEAYALFCSRPNRYTTANEHLAREANMRPGTRILDFAAGIGLTAEAVAASALAPSPTIVCAEPSEAMREHGQKRVPTAEWVTAPTGPFDSILCGAAVWQFDHFGRWLAEMRALLAHGGNLAFNVPSAYLGIPDEPGGGADPLLLQLPSRLVAAQPSGQHRAPPSDGWSLSSSGQVDEALHAAGFASRRWGFRYRLTLAEYANWLRIPVLTNNIMPGQDADERSLAISRAVEVMDSASWRWESWVGWTASI